MGSAGGCERMIPLQFALRRRMMIVEGLLPSGYTQVDYIQSTGSQYIDTGFLVNKNDNYVLEIDGLFPSQAQAYQGCNGYMQFFVSNKYGIGSESSISVGNRDTVRIAYANQTATLTVNGSQAESKSWASYSGANVKLGVLHMGDTNNGWFSGGAASGTIYGYKIWKNNILVSECVPCMRNSDGVAGVYDVIREQFITNAGSGAFKFPVILPFGLKYSGDAEHTINDNKYIVKLLSSGILTVNKTLNASVYLLAGGGGGAYTKDYIGGASGGGGGYQTVEVELAPGTYEIVIGAGGKTSILAFGSVYKATAPSGGDTTAFGYTSTGGGGGAVNYSTFTAGTGGTPNGANGTTGGHGANVIGGSPNGGGFKTGTSTNDRNPTNVTNGGDGYVEITFS